jgi:hypothetical protein
MKMYCSIINKNAFFSVCSLYMTEDLRERQKKVQMFFRFFILRYAQLRM